MSKIQRWIDLLAALLRRHFPASFEELAADVPAYQGAGNPDSLRRKFERDKDELREFGIPIRTVTSEAGEVTGYRLAPKDFYLPYLSVLQDGQPTEPARVDRNGYRALTLLTFDPAELSAIVDAATRVVALGDPVLSGHVESALRKLACDLPVDAVRANAPPVVFAAGQPATARDPGVFDRLGDALERRKRVSFEYLSMGSGTVSRREVEPFGLFFLSQHWYLAAREPGQPTVKNFRLGRISALEVNGSRPGSPDYEVPEGFRLREHARSRHAWELGDSDSVEAVVEFKSGIGAAVTAAELGERVPGSATARSFQVRRLDGFVRWLLALGDAVAPVSPPELVAEYRRQVDATLALYPGVA